jgi:hypothetical protein
VEAGEVRAWRPSLAIPGLAAALALSACGEKSEPDLSNVPAPPQPQAPSPPQGLPQDVVGRWRGTLHQKGIKPFPIAVSIVSATDPSRNVVHYGGEIDCSGTWRYVDASGPLVRFRETIDHGSGGKCKGSGNVEVSVTGAAPQKLRYSFSGGGIKSAGVLSHP